MQFIYTRFNGLFSKCGNCIFQMQRKHQDIKANN